MKPEKKLQEQLDIGRWTYGKPCVVQVTPDAKLRIGKYTSISDGVTIILGEGHAWYNCSTYPFKHKLGRQPIRNLKIPDGDVSIGNDCWIGYNSTILPGTVIPDGCVVGAGSVVVGYNWKPYSIILGNPANGDKKRFNKEIIDGFMELKWWDWPDKKVARYADLLEHPDPEKLYKALLEKRRESSETPGGCDPEYW